GKLHLAARCLQQAASVTAPGPGRDEYAVAALELVVHAGDVPAGERARPAVERLPRTSRRDGALGQLALPAARPAGARVPRRAPWDGHDQQAEPGVGAEAALGLGILLGMAGSFAEATKWLDRVLDGAAGTEPWYDAARCIKAIPLVLGGRAAQALR